MEEEKGRRMKKIISKIEVLILLLFSVNSFSKQNYGQQQYEQIIGFLTEINNTRSKSLNIIPLKINKNVDDLGFILYDLVNRQKFQKIDEILPEYLNDKIMTKVWWIIFQRREPILMVITHWRLNFI